MNNDIYYECDKGWHSLIKEAESIINKYNNDHPKLKVPVKFVQVKEKYGSLCIYLNQYIPELQKTMNSINKLSLHTCEKCGEFKGVTNEPINGYIWTLCPKCRKILTQNSAINSDNIKL